MLSGLKKKFYSSDTVKRQFGKYSDFNREIMSELSERVKILAEESIGSDIKSMLDTSSLNVENFRGKKVVHVSTWDTTCGIAAYCRALKEGLDEIGVLQANDVISIDPDFVHHASYEENERFYNEIARKCENYDIILVQYEFGFFASDKYYFPKDIELFYNFINKLREYNAHGKILIYIHTPLDVLGYKNVVDYFNVSKKFVELSRLKNIYFMANTLNLITNWYFCGVKAALGIDPVKRFYKENLFVKQDLKDKIRSRLDIKENDKILMMLGFINHMKRYDEMAEILALLPENYKLLAAGGIFPDSPDKYLKRFKNKIKNLNLEDRVYITGLFSDEDLGTYLDIADIMCAPYGKVRAGSGSIPMLLLAGKPVVAYKNDMVDSVNNQCEFKPLNEVEYDNRLMFRDTILKLAENSQYYNECCERIKDYSSVISDRKLAELVLKTLEGTCLPK